jgi:excisionase family DNA binding protein
MNATQRKLISEGYATVQEAMRFLGLKQTQTYALVKSNTLSHANHGGRIVIPWAALKAYAAERLVIGRVA